MRSILWIFCSAVFLLFIGLIFIPPMLTAAGAGPHAKVIALENTRQGIQTLLSGPPETVTMKSGHVTLAPGRSVGQHSTGQHEEVLVILSGHGEMLFKDGSTLTLSANHVLYCPPETEHDVKNTGAELLRYVYIVAGTK